MYSLHSVTLSILSIFNISQKCKKIFELNRNFIQVHGLGHPGLFPCQVPRDLRDEQRRGVPQGGQEGGEANEVRLRGFRLFSKKLN